VPDHAVVVDASAIVEILTAGGLAEAVDRRMADHTLHAPAHLDAEVLSALGRLHRARIVSARLVSSRIAALAVAPIERHPLPPLLAGAWKRRGNLRLVDALYAELSAQLHLPLITTDRGLAAAVASAELIED